MPVDPAFSLKLDVCHHSILYGCNHVFFCFLWKRAIEVGLAYTRCIRLTLTGENRISPLFQAYVYFSINRKSETSNQIDLGRRVGKRGPQDLKFPLQLVIMDWYCSVIMQGVWLEIESFIECNTALASHRGAEEPVMSHSSYMTGR